MWHTGLLPCLHILDYPLIKSTTSGRGSWDNGGNVASVGHLYGFGNTLDKALTAVVGCKERGRQVDGTLDHSTTHCGRL